MILWIIIGILWTAFVVIISLLLGMTYGAKETKKQLVKSKSGESLQTKDELSPGAMRRLDSIPAILARVKTLEESPRAASGPAGKDGRTPDANDLIVDPILEMTLAEWKLAVESRLTRVERKAGMSV